VALSGLAQDEVVRAGSDGGPNGTAAGPARDVVVLVSGVARRLRLVGALRRAGYRVVDPRRPVASVGTFRSPVLVTDDTDGACRIRAEVVAAAPETACVVLVDDPTPVRYRQLLASGATALPASSADGDVVLAVGAASRDLACLPATAVRALAGAEGAAPVLTDREASWLRALVDGATVAGLARSVGYSAREMYRILGTLYARLGADNRTEALLRADRWGLLAPPAASPAGTTARASGAPAQRGATRT
jgi:DNA-binding NarL/FixJ family response regulator